MQTKTRQSQFELLRIVSMFMILGLHVNLLAIGFPTTNEIATLPVQSFIRFFAENLCIVGVNVFVLISGWFGINFRKKGLCNLIFQGLFYSILLFIPFAVAGRIEINKINILSTLMLYKNAYWFIWAYLVLYVLTPILNSFIENSEKKIIKRVIILFYVIQTIVFIFTPCGFYKGGYDPLSFIGLYLLARYLKLYLKAYNKYYDLMVYLFCVLANTLLIFIPPMIGLDNSTLLSISNVYVNPLNIIGATALVLFFSKLKIQSKFINWVATSCFAVYLFHMHFCIRDYYIETAKGIFDNYSGMAYVMHISLMIVVFFIIPILLDKVRIFCFNALWKK